ncbi:hypothetical protein TNCV_2279061 [Trichonephila clavipes]|uniref:Mos1 transposase HTH domain-containing protein n=1 Tax=Trichonephila clavipes TaxID=2585209 RepID=A0A8X6UUR0_TRICX|nr:hypothetical protein TNCV_2279061 [Trichonephila clavipes]
MRKHVSASFDEELFYQLGSMSLCVVRQKILVVILPKLKSFTTNGFPQTTSSRSKTPMETLEMISKVYGESTMVRSKAYECHRHFKEGRETMEDNERVV